MPPLNAFVPTRALLNPDFEGYKLRPLDQNECVRSFPLPGPGISQSTVSSGRAGSGGGMISYREVESRIAFNHLAVSTDGQSVGYVSQDGDVVLVTFDKSLAPRFHTVFAIPPTIGTASTLPPEYPTLLPLSSTSFLVSDGRGTLYHISLSMQSDGSLHGICTGSWDIRVRIIPEEAEPESTSAPPTPLRLHYANQSTTGVIRILVSTKFTSPNESISTPATKSQPARNLRPSSKVHFHLSVFTLSLPNSSSDTERGEVSLIWRLKGDDLPTHVFAHSPRLSTSPADSSSDDSSLLLLAASSYSPITDPSSTLNLPISTLPPRPEDIEIMPIPQLNEDPSISLSTPTNPPPPPTPPYSWTQTSDSLTLAFFLPASTNKGDIHVRMTPKSLTLLITSVGIISAGAPGGLEAPHTHPLKVRIPRYESKEWWDGIDASSSFWTWDKEVGKSEQDVSALSGGKATIGVLTLYLEKAHEGTKWSHVFKAQEGARSGDVEGNEDDEEVPETLDPSELYASREALEKYTASLVTGEDASGLGLGRGVPSLSNREVDDEVDDTVGKGVVCTWVRLEDGKVDVGRDAPRILAVPLPSGCSETAQDVSLVVKADVDGLLYGITAQDAGSEKEKWTHLSTYPALSFVLASKRDTRFVLHSQETPPGVVMAFESGSSTTTTSTGGNVYIYRGLKEKKQKWADQAVLKVGGGSAGVLLGVGGVVIQAEGRAQRRVVCLCEKEIVLLDGVLE